MNKKIKLILLSLVIFIACFVSYLTTLSNPFIWDDEAIILKNTLIRDPHLWKQALTSDLYSGVSLASNFYRPLQTFTYIWDYYFWQFNARGYHISNIIFQGLASILVFILLYALSKKMIVSFSAAFLFALCPLHTEAVSYISGRAEMLMGIFLILSFLFFLKSERYKGLSRTASLALALLFFVLGVLSKELSLVFPFVLVAYAIYFKPEGVRRVEYFAKRILTFFVIAAIYLLLRVYLLGIVPSGTPPLANYPFFMRITVLPKVLWQYLCLLVFPVGLHMSWEMSASFKFFGVFIKWLALGALVVGCGYLLRYNPKRKLAAFLLSWALIFILPQSGLLPINAFISEHFIYLSSISFFFLVAYLLDKYLGRALFIVVVILLSFYYAILMYSRNLEWSSPYVFYERLLHFSPRSFPAYMNLGRLYQDENQFLTAKTYYLKALEAKPDLAAAHLNLGSLYLRTRQFDLAEKEYLLAEKLGLVENAADINSQLGMLYEIKGFSDQAISRYSRALSLEGRFEFLRLAIARIHFARKEIVPAQDELLKSFSPEPASRPKLEKIVSDYLLSAPDLGSTVTFYNDLGIRFASLGFLKEAAQAFNMVVLADPRYADGHFNLGLTYARLGLIRQSRLEFMQTLSLNPQHTQARLLLKQAK